MDSKFTGITDILIAFCDAIMVGINISTGEYW